jgi:nucleotide-binding universal stress UspA family protein
MTQGVNGQREAQGGPVLLALSTFRHSDAAVDRALQEARAVGRIVVLFVADRNLARYMVGTDLGYFPDMERTCEEEVLRENEQKARAAAEAIAARAAGAGLRVSTEVCIGRFGIECMRVVERDRPRMVVTTRSRRPAWVRRFFGSPVDYVIDHAGCPVIEA